MTSQVIVLEANNGVLELRVSDNPFKWCEVYLVANAAEPYLGADTAEIIALRLAEWLTSAESIQEDNKNKGQSYNWVASLSEVHYVIYGLVTDHTTNLTFRNTGSARHTSHPVVDSLELNALQRSRWLELLCVLRASL